MTPCLDVASRLEGNLVSQDLQIGRRIARRVVVLGHGVTIQQAGYLIRYG